MNCDKFSELIKMRCESVGSALWIGTPFTFADGDGLNIFVQEQGNHVIFFDDGLTISHLHQAGFDVNRDKRRWGAIRSAIEPYEVELTSDGVIQVIAKQGSESVGFARMVSALLAVAAWAREASSIAPNAAWLIDEAALYLRAWKPELSLELNPAKISGLSGHKYSFDFLFGSEHVDAITPHQTSTNAELRKIIDVKARLDQQFEVRVIIDDRINADAAKQEVSVLGNFAKTWTMSNLIKATTKTESLQ